MWDTTLIAAVIGAILIIGNEWIKLLSEQREQRNKFAIWSALEQTGITLLSLTPEQLSKKMCIPAKKLKPLLYEMIREGTIIEGTFHGTFTRYKMKNN